MVKWRVVCDVMYRIILMWGPLDGQYRMLPQELFDRGKLTFSSRLNTRVENETGGDVAITEAVYEKHGRSNDPGTWAWWYVPPKT